ncbi:Protein kinase-like domain [Pseudocohnilembus persalinus]|uniref:Protein kinase-like domain n=1 Tax=Pseudocohnilembus persalinus TaxID=266149 RepID=A0A0V0QR79_PSEPJ|nr:Protein kinase-like domain [Pseudocohnilembus persalinus]|eukprot:KRX04758.1 Protein kinase-like domain [Pseudocohnilembus persalinus]
MNHSKILKFHDSFINSDGIYLISEYCEDGNLKQYIEKNKRNISKENILQIMMQIRQGLNYLDHLYIIHCDLKPANIYFKKQNDINSLVIGDFGLSQQNEINGYQNRIMGSVGYIAPEILSKEHFYSESCDIYSYGIIFYQLLVNQIEYKDLIDKNYRVFDQQGNFQFDQSITHPTGQIFMSQKCIPILK